MSLRTLLTTLLLGCSFSVLAATEIVPLKYHTSADMLPVAQDFIGTKGDRAIRSLKDQGGLDAGGVGQVDDTLHRGGDQDVAGQFQGGGAVGGVGCPRIARKPAGGGEVALRKGRLLADAGAALKVVAPEIDPQLAELALHSQGSVQLRGYQADDLRP